MTRLQEKYEKEIIPAMIEKFGYKNIMEVHAIAGDNYLGGDDFTEILVNMFLRANELEACNLDSTTIAIIKKQDRKSVV